MSHGYAAVKDGCTKLGFMGGYAISAVVRYGYGFVQGAEAASDEMGISNIEMKYHYTESFEASPQIQAFAASWYKAGTEVIFSAAGAGGDSVIAAAEASGGKVIGVDFDQSKDSSTVITSALKNYGAAAESALSSYYAGYSSGGQSLIFAADKKGVSLPMATSRFKKFTQADYDAVFAKLAAGKDTLKADTDAKDATDLGTKIVKVTIVM